MLEFLLTTFRGRLVLCVVLFAALWIYKLSLA